MSLPGMRGDELMAWVDHTSDGWRQLVTASPEVLAFPCDIRETRSVGEMLQHIVAVELRYAERLHGLPETRYEDVPFDSAAAIYATHTRAMALLRDLQDKDTAAWWETSVEFVTRRGGTLRTTRRAILLHTLMHSIRHYAQLATLVRQKGVSPQWPMDYLFMHVLPEQL